MRILIIEDERSLAEAIAEGLRIEGFDVDLAHDGVTGLWHAREGSFDAIVLDIMLPGLNGYRVCADLRANDVNTPILMLTAKHGEYDEAEGLDTGADDYLTKPFSFVVLLARLRALIRRSRGEHRPLLGVGDLKYDPHTHECSRGDLEIRLTPKEAAVLEAMLSAPRHVATKQDIIDRVWGLDYMGDPNIVEVYIAHLRRKIDRPFDTPMIETLRGTGYRVVAA